MTVSLTSVHVPLFLAHLFNCFVASHLRKKSQTNVCYKFQKQSILSYLIFYLQLLTIIVLAEHVLPMDWMAFI